MSEVGLPLAREEAPQDRPLTNMPVCSWDALKCQHCRKQFKSKAGLNYHTMAEHSTKVSPRAQLPSMLPTGRGSPSPYLPGSDHWPLTSTA